MFELVFGGSLLGLYLAFWLWQSWRSWRGKLAPEEIDRLVGAIEEQLSLPDEERQGLARRLRAWAEADDGKPAYMLNLMRFRPELRRYPGCPEFEGSPEEANALYEKKTTPLLLKHRGVPVIGGTTQGQVLVEQEAALDDWSRVAVVRYPSRRDFLNMMADPAYGPLEPYKSMSMNLIFQPFSGEVVVPDPRLLVGALMLILFLAVGWLRASPPL